MQTNLPKAIPSGSPVLFFMRICLSSSMWIVGVCTTVRSLGLVISCTAAMLGGGLRGWLPIVGGLSGDIGISCLPWRVGECSAGGVSSRDVMWGCWGGGGWVTWSRVWAWEWGTCWWLSSSRSEFAFGVCWVTYNGIRIYSVKGSADESPRVYMTSYTLLSGMKECVYLHRYITLAFFTWS